VVEHSTTDLEIKGLNSATPGHLDGVKSYATFQALPFIASFISQLRDLSTYLKINFLMEKFQNKILPICFMILKLYCDAKDVSISKVFSNY
jgi:hypothetical protein